MRRWVVVLLVPLLVTGCASAVLAGGGKGGESEVHYPGAVDARITRDVNRRLVDDPELVATEVEVLTLDGIVTLGGAVPNRTAAERAERLARSVDGVREVRNRLRVAR